MSGDSDIAIKVEGLHKNFKLPHEKQNSLKGVFLNSFRRKSYELQKVLNDISFEVRKGEFFGIIGRNGSGKSTLLKCIAGVYNPNGGHINIQGSLVPFIELGVGFNPELSGRDNVFLNGSLLGFSRREMEKMYDKIVEFAELGQFMDQKLNNYSSGMQVRLAFSIAIRAHADILLLDEVLAVGDSAFQQKCFDHFSKLKEEKKTIILISHNMPIVERFCDRVILIESGKIKLEGDAQDVALAYEEMFISEERQRLTKETKNNLNDQGPIKVNSIRIKQAGKTTDNVIAGKDFEIEVELKSNTKIPKTDIGIGIKNHDKILVISATTKSKLSDLELIKNKKRVVKFKIQNILANGVYSINLAVADNSGTISRTILKKENVKIFTVRGVKFNVNALTQPNIIIRVD